MTLPVLYEAADFVIVDKPSGLAVHRGEPGLDSDRDWVVQRVRNQFRRYVWPVHRLDRPTSGCLLLTFDPGLVEPLATALRDGRKSYLAAVRGVIEDRDWTAITSPMRDPTGDKVAHTDVLPLASRPEPRCSAVLARPRSGRYHQVRRHLRDRDHPVLGDTSHGDGRVNRTWRERGLTRLALHCCEILLELPTGRVVASSPLPDDLRTPFADLGLWEEALERIDATTLDRAG